MSFHLDCRIVGRDQAHAAVRFHVKRKTTWDAQLCITLPVVWAAALARWLGGRWSPPPPPAKRPPSNPA